MIVRFSQDAREDVQDISDYTLEAWGEEQEAIYLMAIDSILREIAGDPDRWRMRPDLFEDCQMAPVGKHIIFFLVKDGMVFVSRVLHQSMDVSRHLFLL